IRARHQSEGREGPEADDPAVAAITGGPDHRMIGRCPTSRGNGSRLAVLAAAAERGRSAAPRASCVRSCESGACRPGKGPRRSPPHRRYSHVMRPLRYSINVTVDGCCDHRAMFADEDLHRHAVENLDQADALLFGRVTYEMMEAAWR